jgi:hypothetical protein
MRMSHRTFKKGYDDAVISNRVRLRSFGLKRVFSVRRPGAYAPAAAAAPSGVHDRLHLRAPEHRYRCRSRVRRSCSGRRSLRVDERVLTQISDIGWVVAFRSIGRSRAAHA